MQIFYAHIQNKSQAYLEGDEAKHCIKVLRHQEGDFIDFIDGQGGKYEGIIVGISPNRVDLSIEKEEKEWGEHSNHIRFGVSPLRLKDRFECVLEKAVELGVNELVPILCERTHKYADKWKAQRMEKIVLTATKQSKRSRIMKLISPTPFTQFLAEDKSRSKFIGYCEATKPLQDFQHIIQQEAKISILIGPEGDFSSKEMELAKQHQFSPISLGFNRLRTETAAIHTMSFIKWMKRF